MRLADRLLGLVDDGAPALVDQAPPLTVREVVRRFWPYARPYRRRLGLTVALVAVLPILDTATIWLWKLLVDDVLVPRDFGPFPAIAGAYLGLTLLGGALGFADDYLGAWLSGHFQLDLRTSVFAHLQRLSPTFFDRRRLGDLLSRLTGDLAAIETFVLSGVTDALSYGLRIVFFGAALFVLQWQLALASLVVAPAFWVVARKFAQLRKRAARERRRRSGTVSAVAEESLGNIALVQAYGRERGEGERLHREGLAALRAGLASTRIKGLYGPIIELIELCAALIVIGFGAYLLSQDRMTLGALLAFLVYLSELYRPLRSLSRLTNSLFAAAAGAERVAELLDAEPEVTDGPRELPRARGTIELDAVTFTYPGTARPALADLSLRAGPGQVIALVGASGAGKSTVARLLVRFFDPDAGAVRLDGHDVRSLRLADVRSAVTLLLQETLILDGTVRENLAFGRPDASDAELVAAARAADAHDFVVALPDGYDTVVGQRGRLLSGGQRQRLAIARALVRDAPVLVLDEPATALDGGSSVRLHAALQRLMAGRTTLLIAHDLATVRDADQIIVLEEGRVTARGSHEALLEASDTYERLWLAREGVAA